MAGEDMMEWVEMKGKLMGEKGKMKE